MGKRISHFAWQGGIKMKIQSSNISMAGMSTSVEIHFMEQSTSYWSLGGQRPVLLSEAPSQGQPFASDVLTISDQGKAKLSSLYQNISEVEGTENDLLELSDEDKRKIKLIEDLLTYFTGKKVKLRIPTRFRPEQGRLPVKTAESTAIQSRGLQFNYQQLTYESQKMSFSSEGTVKTSDGKEIKFSLDLNMSREFVSRQSISLKAGAWMDPLAVNFDGTAPGLTDRKYSFDIDCDGRPDQISFLSQGSGFLALDLNSDGKINDGSELFGPKSGDGFSDLAQYDLDGNNWIDENDAIFDKLRIWSKDPDGTDRLLALGEKGIGAIYLGNVDTSFRLKDSGNNSLGEIKKSGIFLREDGTAGTIQHIDLTI